MPAFSERRLLREESLLFDTRASENTLADEVGKGNRPQSLPLAHARTVEVGRVSSGSEKYCARPASIK
jgi:hypothetical protein